MNINFPKCSLCGDFYIDKSEVDYLCFCCWREIQVDEKLAKWIEANPIYKNIDNESKELTLLNEICIDAKKVDLRQQIQPPIRYLTSFNTQEAKDNCDINSINRKKQHHLSRRKNNIFMLNKSKDKKT